MRIIIALLVLIVVSCSNQKKENEINTEPKTNFEQYDKLVWSGMLHYKDSLYEQSLNNFQEAFKILDDESTNDYFYAAAAALNLKKIDLAKNLITQSIIKTNVSKSYFKSFKEFDNFRKNEIFKEIDSSYISHQSAFYDQLDNPEIYKEIEILKEKDQEVRKGKIDIEEMQRVDSLNINRLIEINKSYGWQKNQWLLLWHHRGTHLEDNYIWNYFRPLINQKIKDGTLRKGYWARWKDERSMFSEDAMQIYGMYWYNYDQFPIKNIEKVDSLRTTVGLPPLAYIEKVYNVELPKEYDKKLPLTMYIKNSGSND